MKLLKVDSLLLFYILEFYAKKFHRLNYHHEIFLWLINFKMDEHLSKYFLKIANLIFSF